MTDYVLSNEQENIILSNEENILILACPGSGKTHTIISKYIYIINNNIIDPNTIILLTYTKKAANELLTRINNCTNTLPLYVGTLHGFSYKILKDNKIIKDQIIINEIESFEILNKIIDKNNNIDFKNIFNKISTVYPINIKQFLKNTIYEIHSNYIIHIYKLYQKKKKKESLLDYNDLLIELCKFLDKNEISVKYIFFDEYQDINEIQHYILNKLLINSKIMIVGDDAQSIYSFRGSNIKYILNICPLKFKTYYLTYNYRSTLSIINFYQNIINNNNNQIKKSINSIYSEITNKPSIICFKSKYLQYNWIIEDIAILNNVAILAKNNYSLNYIELQLIKLNIKYIRHNNSILNKYHIKIFLAWNIILINKNSILHWNKILELYKIPIEINEINEVINSSNEIIEEIYKNYKILKLINSNNDRFNFILKLLISYFDINEINEIEQLINYFNLNDIDIINFINNEMNINDEINDKTIYLSTIHSSKGLEWDNVYIIDFDNNQTHKNDKNYIDEFNNIEEDRRLLYVGASRAKKQLIITLAITNNYSINPLLKEINNDNYDLILKDTILKNFKPSFNIKIDSLNYLKYNGILNISNIFKKFINITTCNIHELLNLQYNEQINNFSKLLLYKIVDNTYIDNDTISDICYKVCDKNELYNTLVQNNIIKKIDNIKIAILKFINNSNIIINKTVSYHNVTANIDILYKNTMIILCLTQHSICDIIENILNTYILKKNNYNINTIILYNMLSGNISNIDITNIDISKFKNMIYNNKLY